MQPTLHLTEYSSESYKPCESVSSSNPASVTATLLSASVKEDQLTDEESYGDEVQPQLVCVYPVFIHSRLLKTVYT